MNKIKVIDNWLETAQLICAKTNGKTKYDFNKFKVPLKFTSKIYRDDLMLQEAEHDQQKLKILISKLNHNCNPTSQTKIKEKDDTLKSAKKLFLIKEEIINAFKKGIFPYVDGFQIENQEEKQEEKREEETISGANKFNEWVNKQETNINTELFKKYFKIQKLSDMLKYLYQTNDKEKKNKLVNVINSGLKDLNKEIKKMSEKEKEIDDPELIVEIVEEILKFNEQN